MSNIPVLKPREVIRILNKLGFEEVGKKVRISNFAIPMGGLLPCRCISAKILHLVYFIKFLLMRVWQQENSSNYDRLYNFCTLWVHPLFSVSLAVPPRHRFAVLRR